MEWRGLPLLKNPCDLWTLTDLLQRLKPRVIVETGTHWGASALYFAEMMALFQLPCVVITIDFNPKWTFDPATKSIHSLIGLSTDLAIVAQVDRKIGEVASKDDHVLVLLDSDHSRDNVLEEMRLYSRFVTPGSYLVVEDTNVNGHPSFPAHGPGPWEAVQEFLASTDAFEVDRDCERFLLTFNPGGWLKRVKPL
jgi:cephalosporin hydroxylase